MCVIVPENDSISATRIFARHVNDGRWQILVYQMNVHMTDEVAMVLPIPVHADSLGVERAGKFIDLSDHTSFFEDLKGMFPRPYSRGSMTRSVGSYEIVDDSLEVEDVGQFEATWVPAASEFHRVDPRFRLSPSLLEGPLNKYSDHAFAVFKLKPGSDDDVPTIQTIHPMAVAFPTRYPHELYFPTKHMHDGTVHERDDFDHTLYFQKSNPSIDLRWRTGVVETSPTFPDPHKFRPFLMDLSAPVHRVRVVGFLPNEDVMVGSIVRPPFSSLPL